MDIERVQPKDAEIDYIESTLLGIQELKHNLVTQIAHNFRTPLSSVIGFAEMLLEDRPLTDEQRIEYARFIQYEGIRLSKLIDDLIELSALERGSACLRMNDCVVQNIINEAITRIAEFARVRYVTVKTEFPREPISAHCDGEKINQAMYQLLHNAVRLTKPHGEVLVKADVSDGLAKIDVQDGGPGILENEIPTLFERFGRKYSAEQDPHGSGVGLAIVKHIIDLHGGRIGVESSSGKGSTFTVQMPMICS